MSATALAACGVLNPSPPSYQYQKLPGGFDDEIRLLVLLPNSPANAIDIQLIQVRLGDRPKYQALSYTWGDTTVKCVIRCDGKLLQITSSLHQALQALRFTDRDRVLWVDAVCINQEDLNEKIQQLRLMSRIYANGPVVVWLGPADPDVTSALEAYSKRQNLDDGARAALRTICRLPWWSRVWVQQEYYFGKINHGVVFQLGNWTIQDRGMLQIVDDESHTAACVDCAGPYRCFWIVGIVEPSHTTVSQSTLENLLKLFEHKECTEERDRVFAILGILSLEDLLPRLSYTMSLGDIYCVFTHALILTKGHLGPLALSGSSKHSRVNQIGLQSWVVDWSHVEAHHVFPCQLENKSDHVKSSGSLVMKMARSADGRGLAIAGNSIGHVAALNQVLPPKPWTSWTKRQILGDWLVFVANYVQPMNLPHILNFARIFVIDQAPYNVPGRDVLLRLLWDDSQCLNAMLDACVFESSTELPLILQRAGFEKTPSAEGPDWQSQILDQTYPQRPNPLPLDPPAAQLEAFNGLPDYVVDKSIAPKVVRRNANDPRVAQTEVLLRNIDRWGDYRWFATVDGHIGLGPRNTELNDEVIILYGGTLPFVVRADMSGNYELLGDCYIHHLVSGEGVNESKSRMYSLI